MLSTRQFLGRADGNTRYVNNYCGAKSKVSTGETEVAETTTRGYP